VIDAEPLHGALDVRHRHGGEIEADREGEDAEAIIDRRSMEEIKAVFPAAQAHDGVVRPAALPRAERSFEVALVGEPPALGVVPLGVAPFDAASGAATAGRDVGAGDRGRKKTAFAMLHQATLSLAPLGDSACVTTFSR
jgi:hypothetical protein